MDAGWVRLSRTCNNACHFCLDAENLDNAPIALEQITADIDAVAASGAQRVILSGGEPTLSKHLLTAIRHAKAKGLYVILSTNARIIQSDKIGKMLEDAGLSEIRIGLQAARRTTHEILVGSEKAWVETNAALKVMGRTNVRVVMNTVLMKPNASEIVYLMHLAMMGGMKELHLRAMKPLGRATSATANAELVLGLTDTLKTIAEVWYNAKEDVIQLVTEGFDHTMDEGVFITHTPNQADEAALRMLRQRVQLHYAVTGFKALDDEGLAKDLTNMYAGFGGMSEVGHELLARSAPILDLPACVGGRGATAPDGWGDDAYFAPACAECPVRASCAGVPRKLTRSATGALEPLPFWSGVHSGPAVIVPGADPIFATRTAQELAAALVAEGLDAVVSDDPARIAQAALVVAADAGALARVLAVPDRRAGQRVEALDADLTMTAGATVVRSFAPGLPGTLQAALVPLRTVLWRPWPAPTLNAPRADSVGRVLVLGETADWATFRQAIGGSGMTLGNVDVIDATPDQFATETVRAHGAVSDERFLELLAAARMVVLPGRRHDGTAEDRARLAHDLRRLAIAQAAGRPIVVHRGAASEDQVRHERTGLLFRPGHGPDLQAAMRRLHTDPVLFARCAEGALKHGALSTPAVIARELVHGARPESSPRWETPGRPLPAW